MTTDAATVLARATEAIVAQHDEELKAYLRGEISANVWRPEKYAAAVLRSIGYEYE